MNLYAPAFLCVFLPVAAGAHTLIKNQTFRNGLLLAAGLVFYAFGSISGVAVLLAAALVNYAFGAAIRKSEKRKKLLSGIGTALNLSVLFGYKYLGFFFGVLPALPQTVIPPLGISFFTFKCISYLADTCRGKSEAAGSCFELLLYISFFPQAVAGPITRFGDFSAQLTCRRVSADALALGFRRLTVGLAKKVFLVSALSEFVDCAFSMEAAALGAPLAWLAAIAFTLQIFLDFSAYSDMAIGLGRMFGFTTPENFAWPYLADSIGAFWRRWHISLSAWFRDYLYIPLGGNRRGKWAAAGNKLIVFVLCGLWHGAAWTFLLWGLWHGLLSALETLQIIPVEKAQRTRWGRALLRIGTLAAVSLGFVVFRASTLAEAWKMFGAMFSLRAGTAACTAALHGFFGIRYAAAFLLSIALCFPVEKLCADWERRFPPMRPISYVSALALLALSFPAIASQGFQPFIYARF